MTTPLRQFVDALLASWAHTEGMRSISAGYGLDDLHADVAAAVEATARRCAEIAERHRNEWIRPSEGAQPVVVAAHACVLVIDEIKREFGITEGGESDGK